MERSAIRDQRFGICDPTDFAALHPSYEASTTLSKMMDCRAYA
jgi:hypothetical protein